MHLLKKLYSVILVFSLSLTAAFAQMPQQVEPAADVSDNEMEQFAAAFQGIQQIDQELQPELVKAVQEEGIEVQRFNEIMNAQQDPNQEMDADEAELQKFASASREIEEIQTRAQKEMEEVVTKSGLGLERYQAIMAALQSDAELQQRLQQMMQEE